ncbi:MAG: hypothetical protein V1695_01475 [Candidatus Uhrbacteria bacterium]
MDKLFKTSKSLGFTFAEALMVIAIILVIFSVTVPLYSQWQTMNVNEAHKYELVQDVRLVQGKAIAGLNNSNHGIYLLTSQYTLYQGDNYTTRDQSQDIVRNMSEKILLSGITEINFEKKTGEPSQTGTITLTNTADNSTEVIDIKVSGTIY